MTAIDRTFTASATPTVTEEHIERARSRKIVDVAEDAGLKLKVRKNEHWASCCFHEEDTPSLSFNPEKNVFYCHGCGAGGDVIDFTMKHGNLGFAEAVLKLADEPAPVQPEKPRRLLSTERYEIRDEASTLEAIHLRKDFDGGKKEMPWLHPDGRPSTKDDPIEPANLSLYGVHEVGDADEVLVCEGEKAREVAKTLGIPAVGTVTGASGMPGDAALRPLIGKRTVFWADNDAEGRKHKDRTAERLIKLGQPAELVRDLIWPEAPPKGDVADFAAVGGTGDDVRARMAVAPAWVAPANANDSKSNASRLVIRSMSTVVATETDWLWRRYLARGKFHLYGGLAGDGKSTMMAWLAAIGSVGGIWPDGTDAPLFRTLFLLGEDALDDTLRPRLDVHGANPELVFAIETVLDDDGHERFFNVEKHLPLLEDAIGDYGIDVVCIDPLTTIMSGRDRNAEGDTRDALTPLIKLADRRNVAIMGLAHVGKPGPGQRTAAQRILGATAFHALARVVWMTVAAKDERMALGVVKSNLAMKPEPLLWSRAEDGPIVWHGVSEESVDELLQEGVSRAPRADAEGFLCEVLAAGSMASGDIEQQAKGAGISWRTLRRAADTIGVKKWKEGGMDGRWYWRLPDGEPVTAERNQETSEGNLATSQDADNIGGGNLANPKEYQVDNLANFHNRDNLANTAQGGQVHATTPVSPESGASGANTVMEGVQLGHTEILRVGQVPTSANGNGHAEPIPVAVLPPLTPEAAKFLALLQTAPAEELAELDAYRAELAQTPDTDPLVADERLALAHFDSMQAIEAAS
jgi:hypothetical protein